MPGVVVVHCGGHSFSTFYFFLSSFLGLKCRIVSDQTSTQTAKYSIRYLNNVFLGNTGQFIQGRGQDAGWKGDTEEVILELRVEGKVEFSGKTHWFLL